MSQPGQSEQFLSGISCYIPAYPVINVRLITQMLTMPWNEDILDKESILYRRLAESVTTGVS